VRMRGATGSLCGGQEQAAGDGVQFAEVVGAGDEEPFGTDLGQGAEGELSEAQGSTVDLRRL